MLLEKTRPAIKIYGFEEVDLAVCTTSPILRRQILDILHVEIVVFDNRIEVRYQIAVEIGRSINIY
jgi:hypothetical protein